MNYITALLAFAAFMTLASTLVAVILEGANRALDIQRKRLRALVGQFYRDAVTPRIADVDAASAAQEDGDQFATVLLADPAHGTEQVRDLTVRQLMEQLAGTQAGAALRSLSRGTLQARLEALAYEFDRLGAASRERLRRRARVWSVVIAFVMAFSLNVDAFRLFGGLVQDRALTQLLIQAVDVDDLQRQYTDASNALARRPTDPVAQAELARLERTLADVRAAASLASGLHLPVGAMQYPYCLPYSPLFGAIAAADRAAAGATAAPAPVTPADPRCVQNGLVRPTPPAPACASKEGGCTPADLQGLLSTRMTNWWRDLPTSLLKRVNTDTLHWFVGVLIAGGMIGLGAPFWFNVYRSIAALVPAARVASNAISGVYSGAGSGAAAAARDGGRRADAHVMDGDGLYQAFATTSGDSPVIARPGVSVAHEAAGGAEAAGPVSGSAGGGGRRRLV